MTKKRAFEIANICSAHALYSIGLLPQVESLDGVTLDELLKAKQIVKRANITSLVCEDDYLAALYLAYSFEPVENGPSLTPVVTAVNGNVVGVMKAVKP